MKQVLAPDPPTVLRDVGQSGYNLKCSIALKAPHFSHLLVQPFTGEGTRHFIIRSVEWQLWASRSTICWEHL